MIPTPRRRKILLRQIPVANALGKRVNEHGRGRRFEIVTFPFRQVEDLVPEPGRFILHFHHGCGGLIEDGDQSRPPGMIARQMIENVDDRHHIPANAASPEKS